MRMQLVKLVDYLRSEAEDIRFSNASLEVTMAALERIQARHSKPTTPHSAMTPAPGGEGTAPLTANEIQEYLKLKRELESPGPSILETSDMGSDDNDASVCPENTTPGVDVDMELTTAAPDPGGVLASTMVEPDNRGSDENSDDDSDNTDISSQGLTTVLPSEPHLDDTSEELGSDDSDTSMSSTGFSLEPGSEAHTASPAPAAPAAPVPRLRGPVKFPSRLNPMPYCLGPHPSLSRSPSIAASEPYPVLPGPSVERRKSDSPIITTSPVPMPTRGYVPAWRRQREGKQPAVRDGEGSDILDLTI